MTHDSTSPTCTATGSFIVNHTEDFDEAIQNFQTCQVIGPNTGKFITATAAPYGADPTGETDSSAALMAAGDDSASIGPTTSFNVDPDSPLPTAIATEEQYVAVEGALNDYRATPAACSVCLGSGQVADDGEITPWPIWEATGPHPDQEDIEAISCPKCEGRGSLGG